jgi:hypothetical protein
LTAHPTAGPLAWLGADGGHLRTLAEIWATVDLERSLPEFRTPIVTASAGANPDPATIDPRHAAEDALLGARVLVLTTDDGRRIALAEPSREGRLAGTLARHGEGHIGAYLESPFGLDVVATRAAAANLRLSRFEMGPFGRSVLVLPGRDTSRLLILVERPAVPSPA